MVTWNKRTIKRIGIALVVIIPVILVGQCFVDSATTSSFERIVEYSILSALPFNSKCESQDIGSVEHIACQGSNDEGAIFLLAADYPEPIAEVTGYAVLKGNTVDYTISV